MRRAAPPHPPVLPATQNQQGQNQHIAGPSLPHNRLRLPATSPPRRPASPPARPAPAPAPACQPPLLGRRGSPAAAFCHPPGRDKRLRVGVERARRRQRQLRAGRGRRREQHVDHRCVAPRPRNLEWRLPALVAHEEGSARLRQEATEASKELPPALLEGVSRVSCDVSAVARRCLGSVL